MAPTESSAEREIMPTSHRGNNEGFALIDAMIALFIAGVAIVAVFETVSISARFATKQLTISCKEIDKRNILAQEWVDAE